MTSNIFDGLYFGRFAFSYVYLGMSYRYPQSAKKLKITCWLNLWLAKKRLRDLTWFQKWRNFRQVLQLNQS